MSNQHTARQYALKRIVRETPLIRMSLLRVEKLVKTTLAQLLWQAWRLQLNPFGFLRGIDQTSGRFYIRHFLAQYAPHCQGHFLEFGDPYFRDLFSPAQITAYDILDVIDRGEATIVADIQHCPEVASNTYDVIVCTQVLEHIANPFKAIAELQRILKPGGTLLLTVPAAYPYHAIPQDYWRYTRDSLHLLLDPGFEQVTVHSYGNQLVVVAAYWYWMADHLPRQALMTSNPDCPTILCAYAIKSASKT
ncbi:MAG: class I SAM-dependent methyltransferase [Chloroflexaceae bacterium]|nr:class I SAM-dependent methyltransferase [Chloroflexaceae bacterium]